MQRFIVFLSFLFFCSGIGTARGQVLQVRDLWSNQPLAGVRIVAGSDTVFSDFAGRFSWMSHGQQPDSLHLAVDGYFDQVVKRPELKQAIIYLVPIESTGLITVIQPRSADSRLMLPAHITRLEIDSRQAALGSTVDELLRNQSGLFLKSYGSGGQIQSISVRGMGAEQTQVLLDGIPMNNLQLGSVDFGHYALDHLGSLEIYRGGNALFGGSGAIGGSIDLHPAAPQGRFGYQLTTRLVSFANRTLSARVDIPLGKWQQRFGFSALGGENDYPVRYDGQKVTLRNRDYKRRNYHYQSQWAVTPQLMVKTFLSSFKSEAGASQPFINPNTEQSNVARIAHDNNLYKLQLRYQQQTWGWQLQVYGRNEWMTYKDAALQINNEPLHSLHFNKEQGMQLRGRYLVSPRWLVHAGFDGALQGIRSSEAGKHQRHHLGAYVLSDWQVAGEALFWRSVHLQTSLRSETYPQKVSVLLPGAGLSIKREHAQFFISAGRNYRVPTFNEWYWQPGGNAQLQPEKSLNWETGFEYERILLNKWNAAVQVYFYSNRVYDQIKWMPQGAFWSPQNISEVISRGLEMETQWSDLSGRHRLIFNYRYGIAEKNKAEFPGDGTVGKQLPYLPREQWNLNLQSGLWLLRYGLQVEAMSFRYTSLQNDAGQVLPANTTLAIWAAFTYSRFEQEVTLGARVENLFNANYEIINGYPMPPRSFSISLTVAY